MHSIKHSMLTLGILSVSVATLLFVPPNAHAMSILDDMIMACTSKKTKQERIDCCRDMGTGCEQGCEFGDEGCSNACDSATLNCIVILGKPNATSESVPSKRGNRSTPITAPESPPDSESTTVPEPRTEVKFGAKVDSGKVLSLPGADNKDEVQLPVTGIVPRTDPFSKAKTKPGAMGGFKVIPGLPTPSAKTKIKRPVATDSTKVKDKVKTTPPAADKSQPVKVVQPSQPVVIKKPKKAEADVPEPQPLQPDTPTAMPAPAELAPAPTIKLKKMKKSE